MLTSGNRKKISLAVVAGVLLLAVLSLLLRQEQTATNPPGGVVGVGKATAPSTKRPTPGSGPARLSTKNTWAHNGSGLQPDPHARWGELPNGLRYVIYPHPIPANQVSVRLLVEAGSLMEEDDQQGVAHFVEHMAFNGTRHFEAGDTMERFQRLGMRSGADTNASTSFDHTTYKLDLPDTEPDVIDEAMLFLRDAADGILFEQNEIELERAVVLSEMREGRLDGNAGERHYRTMLPESLLSKRFPIGLEQTIQEVTRQRLVDFYQKYYTANRMVVVVAGDIEIGKIESRIFSRFATLAETPRAPDPDIGEVNLDLGVIASSTGPEHSKRVWIRALHPPDVGGDSPEQRHLRLVQEVANKVVAVRTHHSRTLPEIDCSRSEDPRFLVTQNMTSPISTDNWREQLRIVASEWKRFRDLGFTEHEIAVTKTELLRQDLEQLRDSLTQTSKTIADDIVESVVARRVHLSPQDRFARRRTASATITKKECEEEFAKLWDAKDVYVILPQSIALRPGEEIETQLLRGWDDPIYPEQERERPELKYIPIGPPGEVLRRREDESLGAVFVDFENGVRLNYKSVATVPGVFDVRASLPGGALSTPAGKTGIRTAASHLFVHGGSRFLSGYDLLHATAGLVVECKLRTGPDAFRLYGTATTDQIQIQMRLMCARLTETNWDRGDEIWSRERTRQRHDSQTKDFSWHWYRLTRDTILGWDERLASPSGKQVTSHSANEVENWLRGPFQNGPIELTIIGDVSLESAIRSVAATFGALPSRAPILPEKSRLDLPPWPKGERDEAVFETGDDNEDVGKRAAIFELAWRIESSFTHEEDLQMQLLQSVIQNRLRREIRELEGLSYSPRASYYHLPPLGDLSTFHLRIPTELSRIDTTSTSARALVTRLLEEGIDADELERAVKPMLRARDLRERDPDFWMDVLDRSGAHPEQLLIADDRKILKACTVSQLNQLARQYLKLEAACEFRYLPAE